MDHGAIRRQPPILARDGDLAKIAVDTPVSGVSGSRGHLTHEPQVISTRRDAQYGRITHVGSRRHGYVDQVVVDHHRRDETSAGPRPIFSRTIAPKV